jgi:hypothetical protein
MTCREKLKLEHPCELDPEQVGGCNGCPSDYGYLPDPGDCKEAVWNCTKCWDREIPEIGNDKNPNFLLRIECFGEVMEWPLANPDTKETNGEKEMEEKYKYYYNRATELDLAGERREWLVNRIKYLQDTVIPAIEEEVRRRNVVLEDWKEQFASKEESLKVLQKRITYLDDDKRILNLDIEKKAKEIKRLEGVIKELEELNVSKQNEIAELKKDNERLKNKVNALTPSIPPLKLKDDAFKKYCTNDVEMTKKLYMWNHDYGMLHKSHNYHDTAMHMRRKYESLKAVGFSHDDAMSLIPMWTDDCEVGNAD